MSQPKAPLRLDLDKPMQTPMLLAAGAMGGLGNPHFVTKSITRPKFATKGDEGMRIQLDLQLKQTTPTKASKELKELNPVIIRQPSRTGLRPLANGTSGALANGGFLNLHLELFT